MQPFSHPGHPTVCERNTSINSYCRYHYLPLLRTYSPASHSLPPLIPVSINLLSTNLLFPSPFVTEDRTKTEDEQTGLVSGTGELATASYTAFHTASSFSGPASSTTKIHFWFSSSNCVFKPGRQTSALFRCSGTMQRGFSFSVLSPSKHNLSYTPQNNQRLLLLYRPLQVPHFGGLRRFGHKLFLRHSRSRTSSRTSGRYLALLRVTHRLVSNSTILNKAK